MGVRKGSRRPGCQGTTPVLEASGGCFAQKTRRNIPQRSRTSTTSWVRRFRSWPRNRLHPITDTVEELPEDQLEELSNSKLEEEALPTSVACRAACAHGPQKVLVVGVPQASAEEQPLWTLKTYGAAYEHAPQEDLVVKRREAWAEKQPMRTPKESGAVYEHGFTEDLPVNSACDRTEETPCVSKVALSGCESDCFLESISSSDEEETAASPHDCCPQKPENFTDSIEELEQDNKNMEMSKSSLVIFLKSAFGNIISNDEEDLEEQV
ncbi:hypothetical protein R6Z07M_011371 [Ovis aries]